MSASKIKFGRTKFKCLDTTAQFSPDGTIQKIGDVSDWYTSSARSNPIKRREKRPTQGCRILMGFNIGTEEKITMKEVVTTVHAIRRKQVSAAIADGDAQPHPLGGDIGASFIAQAGLWQDLEADQAYPENGVQIAIMNTIQEKPQRFADDMIAIAEELVERYHQNAVIVEMSERGVVEETVEVGP